MSLSSSFSLRTRDRAPLGSVSGQRPHALVMAAAENCQPAPLVQTVMQLWGPSSTASAAMRRETVGEQSKHLAYLRSTLLTVVLTRALLPSIDVR